MRGTAGQVGGGKKKIALVIFLVILPFLFLIPFLGGMGYIFLYSAKDTEIYRCAVEEAQRNKKIVDRIGEPIEPGTLVYMSHWGSGKFREEAELSTSLTGPKGSGTLHIEAARGLEYSVMRLVWEDGNGPEVVFSGEFPCKRQE